MEELLHALGLKEDPSKNDLAFVKRGLSIELQESRDMAGHIQFQVGETTVAAFKTFLEGLEPGVHIGHVFGCISAQEECPGFLAFLRKQAKRLRFKLIVTISQLPAHRLGSMEQFLRERGGSRMQ